MRKKKAVVAAIMLVVLGALICAFSFAALGFDWKALNSAKFVTNEHEIRDRFENISVSCDTTDIVFVPAKGSVCTVVCYEDEKQPHDVRVKADTLTIDQKENSKWHFGLYIGKPLVTVYLPEEAYKALTARADTGDVTVPEDFSFERISVQLGTGDAALSASASGPVSVRTSTGRIDLQGLAAGELTLSSGTGKTRLDHIACEGKLETNVSTGDAELADVACAEFSSNGDTGDLSMKNVICAGAMQIRRNTGDVRFEACDAEEITVKTGTGDVAGTILSDKVFQVQTGTGKTDVPKTISGGKCEITTGTGSVRISIA